MVQSRQSLFARILAASTFTTMAAAQIYTTDARVASPELLQLEERVDYLVRDRGEDLRAATTLVWSPADWLQTDWTVPFLHRRARFPSGGGFVSSEVDGLGDVVLNTKWALLRNDEPMETDRVSLLAGVLLPTGDYEDSEQGVPLPRRLQLGLGCPGAAVGLGATWVRDRHRAAVAFRGWHFAEHDGFAPGEELSLDLAWWYRLSPARFGPGMDGPEWRMTVELLSRWVADDELAGQSQQNGGGEVAAALGLQCSVVPSVRVEVGARAPLASDLDHPAGDERFMFPLSVRCFF
ncbi:MAG TPA: transporter [Planctomycetota bacterium]|nr:transporter [Planctomycetota bacterium]